jgi:hypothetical protein
METIASPERRGEGFTASSSTGSAIAGLAALVLSIIGLAEVARPYMLTIAGIVLGVGMLIEGGFVVGEYARILQYAPGRTQGDLGGGLSTEALTGVAGITLSILALIGIVPAILMSIAVIVLGVGMLVGSGVVSRLNTLKIETAPLGEPDMRRRVAYDATRAAAGTEVLVSLAAIVLGIVALVGVNAEVLSLVATLALGAGLMLAGGALLTRTLAMFSR